MKLISGKFFASSQWQSKSSLGVVERSELIIHVETFPRVRILMKVVKARGLIPRFIFVVGGVVGVHQATKGDGRCKRGKYFACLPLLTRKCRNKR